jgi:hypothetical protein
MRTRHLGKALIGLAATAATVGLLGLPAAAHTVSATAVITGGTLSLTGSGGPPPITTQTLGTGGTGVSCVATSGTITMSDGPAAAPHAPTTIANWTFTQTSATGVLIGGQWFRSELTITFHPSNGSWVGTYTSGVGGGTLTGTGGTATAVLRKSTATTPCVAIAGPCTIAVADISVTGTHTVDPTPDIAVNDTATVSGGTNGEGDLGFEVSVGGTASDCGSLITADDGAASFSNVTILVTSVP